MSHADHEWAKEQIAAHLAGGLSADERARLEAHIGACAECIAEVDAARRFEKGMEALFAPVRPQPGLEERVIRWLRVRPEAKPRPFAARAGMAIAAIVLLGVLGFALTEAEFGAHRPVAIQSSSEEVSYGGPAADRPNPSPPAPPRESPVMPGGLNTAPLVWSDPNKGEQPLASAREMAKEKGEKERAYWTRDVAGLYEKDRDVRSGERNESADDEEFKKSKGDSLDFVSDKPFKGSGNYDAIGRGGGAGGKTLLGRTAAAGPQPPASRPADGKEANKLPDNYYSYRSNVPAPERKPAPANAMVQTVADPPLADNRRKDRDEVRQVAEALREGEGTVGKLIRQPVQEPARQEQPPPVQRKIIRSGEMEFEVESFDGSVATVVKIAAEEQGFVATVNSEKLPNGKVRGTVVVRCPPDNLDRLLMKLRALGELKSQRIGSQDVTKLYTDLESRLRAGRTMEERLLKIIKDGRGEIKDLLLAEKELGEWRTKIESLEGEIRYYGSLISLSTLTVTLSEKEIRAPSGVTETEKVQMGIEVEDVEKAHKDALAAAAEAKGRVTFSELKQTGPGLFQAQVRFEVDPDKAGALRDRLKQLGMVSRLDAHLQTQTEGGVGRVGEVKVKRNDTQFDVGLYNLATTTARENVQINLAAIDAEGAFKAILARVEKAGGRVVSSNLNRQKSDQTTGTVQFEIKAAEADAVEADVKALGELMLLQRNENRDVQGVTRSKKGFLCQIFALGAVQPRETTTVQLACADVAKAYHALLEAVQKSEGRILSAQLNENDRQRITAGLDFDVRRDHKAAIEAALRAAGEIYSRQSSRAQDVENVIDTKTRLTLTLVNVANIPARETFRLGVEVSKVEEAAKALEALAAELKGRVVESHHTRDVSGRDVSRMVLTVPLSAAKGAVERVKKLGNTLVADAGRNPAVPESELAVAQLDVTLSNEVLVSAESTPWANIKRGFSVSATVGSWALMLVIIGLCAILPVGLVLWLGARIYRRLKPRPAPAA